jgi:hypothetical protein
LESLAARVEALEAALGKFNDTSRLTDADLVGTYAVSTFQSELTATTGLRGSVSLSTASGTGTLEPDHTGVASESVDGYGLSGPTWTLGAFNLQEGGHFTWSYDSTAGLLTVVPDGSNTSVVYRVALGGRFLIKANTFDPNPNATGFAVGNSQLVILTRIR